MSGTSQRQVADDIGVGRFKRNWNDGQAILKAPHVYVAPMIREGHHRVKVSSGQRLWELFARRFGDPPPWAPERPPVPVERMSLLENRRSTPEILAAAHRLIARNVNRLKTEPLVATRPAGSSR